jgi:hypothetical protein
VTRLKSGQIGVDWPVKRRYPGLEAGPISDWPDNQNGITKDELISRMGGSP